VNFHRRLADGLEGLQAPADLEMAAKIALHWEEGGDDERATRYLILAAQNATHRYAHREAIATLEHARDLLQRLEPESREQFELQILERIGRAYYALGDMGRSAEHYRAMATLAAHEGLLADQTEALIRLSRSRSSFGRSSSTRALSLRMSSSPGSIATWATPPVRRSMRRLRTSGESRQGSAIACPSRISTITR
jgi:hypothetical protein